MANFAALATALHAKGGAGVTRRGVRGLEADPVIYASTLVHMSVPKAAGLLGIGRDAVRTVPIGPDFAIDCAALEAAIAGDRGAGRLPLAVVASAGDVNTGGFDSIRAVTEVCRTERVWCHVDACYGGFAALAPSARPLFDGIEQADSVALDPHKWLFTPLDAGCLLVRDPSTLRSAFSHGGDYLDVVDSPSDFAFWDYGLELSRRFRALKIWMILKRHGTAAIGDAIERNLRLARRLGDLVNASDDFERLAPVGLSIVCFRHLPATLRAAVSSSDPAERARASDRADALNRAILVALQRGGADAYLSNASIDGRFALRACLVNYRTTEADLEILLDVVRDTARRIGPGM
jgi:glutamate/tyrosine decarboxylase-like PLP-dependent enzyme